MSLATRRYRKLFQWIEEYYTIIPRWNIDEGTNDAKIYKPSIWIEGLVLQESSGNPSAHRYEPAIDQMSYGLGQILQRTAESLLQCKFLMPGVIARPMFNVSLIAMTILDIIDTIENQKLEVTVPLILARYNGGILGNPDQNGKLRNQFYVDLVLTNTILANRDINAS